MCVLRYPEYLVRALTVSYLGSQNGVSLSIPSHMRGDSEIYISQIQTSTEIKLVLDAPKSSTMVHTLQYQPTGLPPLPCAYLELSSLL